MTLKAGQFVRVRADHPIRGGKDGMVRGDFGDEIALFFGTDRHNESQNVHCVGTEMWERSELDMTTLE